MQKSQGRAALQRFGYSTALDLGFWHFSIFGSPDTGISQAAFSFG
jgi:hypothetical protein